MASATGITVMIFHRDLRIVDHKALEAAAKHGAPVLPLFVFTPEQVSEKNTLRSLNSIQFMLESLKDLEAAIHGDGGKLVFAYGDTAAILRSLHRRLTPIAALVETADYTPYALKRTAAMKALCAEIGATYEAIADSYLLEPGTAKNRSGKTFQKFTPFYEAVRGRHIDEPMGRAAVHWWRGVAAASGLKTTRGLKTRRAASGLKTRRRPRIPGEIPLATMIRRLVPRPNAEIAVHGGRAAGLKLLEAIPRDYAAIHDVPSRQTSMLSAHNHFGTLSIREVYARGKKLGLTEFVRQLWWRDFYGHIMADFETLYGVDAYEFQKTASREPSEKAKKAFRDWCDAKTGVPLVDAGMNQLLRTGYMHNRVRLVVASWLVKDMGVHWRLGERFFARHLVDYDPAQNMMNWIWVASVLPFSQAPFRRIDAYKTAEKFDADGEYVKKWAGSD